ncbi:hypothetical protein KM043_009328 [Ampulex compressa]|nr:hypothetical protein KM043_009328 [Ampulex compressa]
MHKLAKGLKKKKKPKKGKKGAEEEEFDPEELERYRRERAEAQQKAEESGEPASNTGSDEWKKFEALTAGVDSILRKTQGDLDRIKSTSFFQRKAPLEEERRRAEEEEQEESKRSSSKKWVGFDEEGNPIEEEPPDFEGGGRAREEKPLVSEDGFVEVPDDEDEHEDSADEDIFDTTYVDVLRNIDVQLAYIPDSPTEEETGDDPFDTTNAEKVLKTVDKRGNKLVSLGNAVEVLSGRIDHVSTCKLTKGRRPRLQQDLLLDDFEEPEAQPESVAPEPIAAERTLLDDDSDLPDIPVDLTKLPPVLPRPVTPVECQTVVEPVPSEFDVAWDFEEDKDPKQRADSELISEASVLQNGVRDRPEADIAAEEVIEKEGEKIRGFVSSNVSISLTDPSKLETILLKLNGHDGTSLQPPRKDLLGGSTTDLSQLADQPIAPLEEITYVDPFDTSAVKDIPPGKTELKFLEKELLGEQRNIANVLEDDDDFDPRKEEEQVKPAAKTPPTRPSAPPSVKPSFQVNFENEKEEEEEEEERAIDKSSESRSVERRTSRPEVLDLPSGKVVAFELPTPSKRPDLLATSEEEKTLPSKPLTPYYTEKSVEESLPPEELDLEVDPFDTSFVARIAPGKTELKLIESELLKQETKLPHSLSDHDFDPRSEAEPIRRQSDFTASSLRPSSLKFNEVQNSLVQKFKEETKRAEPRRQESLLDAEVEVDAKPLTPRVESKVIEEEEELSYADPFDTSIATNILPGKAELKILENELRQVPEQVQVRANPISLVTVVQTVPEVDDFDPRADERKESKDFLCSDDQDLVAKVLTPLQNKDFSFEEDDSLFDTSFVNIGPGKTELKILESELMEK